MGRIWAAIEVPVASFCSSPRPRTIAGTIIAPPPMPKAPPATPAIRPIARSWKSSGIMGDGDAIGETSGDV